MSQPPADHPPLQILIVEDDDNDVVLLQQALRRGGLQFDARVVDQLAGFTQALESGRTDLVISDFRLPRFDALGALEVLRHHARKTPFIVHAGGLDEETAVLCLKLGAADCVPKGETTRLLAAVRAALDRKRLVEERELAVREAESRFRLLADLAPVLIWQCDALGRFHYFNKAWSDFAGAIPRDGTEWIELVHPEDRQRCQHTLAEKLTTHQPCQLELRLRRGDGQFRTVLCQAAPIVDSRDGFRGFVGSGLDVTERVGAVPAAPPLRPGLRHEFNNRLGIIRMTADIMAEMPGLPPAALQRAQEISRAADYACELVRELPSSTPPRLVV